MAQTDTDTSKQTRSTFVTNAVVVAIATVIAWVVTTYISYRSLQKDIDGLNISLQKNDIELKRVQNEVNRYSLEQEKTKIELVNLIREKENTLALALIDYYESKYGEDATYKGFLKAVRDFIDTTKTRLTPQQTEAPDQTPSTPTPQNNTPPASVRAEIATITPDLIRDQFFSANRRVYAEYLVDLYRKSSPDE